MFIMTMNVLVVATSHKTRGGITAVVNAHKQGEQWDRCNCKWIETHIDRSRLQSVLYLLKAIVSYVVLLPKASIVHIHLSEPMSALRKLFFFFFANILKKKILVHFHAFSPDSTIRGKFSWIYKYMFRHSTRVIVLSQKWKKDVYDTFQNDNIEVIYNPCTSKVSTMSYAKEKKILFAGTINERKGYADLIKAFAMIAAKYPDWKVVFAGNGEIVKGNELAQKLNIAHQCEFLGWVTDTDKDKVFKQASIFCLPSYAEGFPMAVLDAWVYGLPVITTPVGGIPDIAIDNENMLLFSPGDIETLSNCIERLILDKDLYDKIQRASSCFAKKTFSVNEVNHQIEQLYKNIIKC